MRLPLSCRSVEDPGHCNTIWSQVEAQTQCVLLNHRPASFHSGRRAARNETFSNEASSSTRGWRGW